jgi:hypothetical protein
VISRGAIELERANEMLCVLDVEGFPIVRPRHVITRAGFALSPPAATFCAELRRPGGQAATQTQPGTT